jgi:F-type H+-transporting ATPase subunit beta
MTFLREMIESGVIKYGDEFKHGMEKGDGILSKVDMKELKRSKQHSFSDK